MAPAKANGRGVQVEDTRICVVMVGLPARGKSYIAQKGTVHTLSASSRPEPLPSLPLHHSQLQFQQLTQYLYRQL